MLFVHVATICYVVRCTLDCTLCLQLCFTSSVLYMHVYNTHLYICAHNVTLCTHISNKLHNKKITNNNKMCYHILFQFHAYITRFPFFPLHSLFMHISKWPRTLFNHPNRFIINSYQYFLIHKFAANKFFFVVTQNHCCTGFMVRTLLATIFKYLSMERLFLRSKHLRILSLFFPIHLVAEAVILLPNCDSPHPQKSRIFEFLSNAVSSAS